MATLHSNPLINAGAALTAALLLLASSSCDSSGKSSELIPGLNPGNARLLTVEYGRLVDVFGLVSVAGEMTVQEFRRDVMVGPDITDERRGGANIPDDLINYDFLSSNPDNLQPRLLIPRLTGSPEFIALFDALDNSLRQVNAAVFGQDPKKNNPFTVVPRNASLRLRFSASLGVDDDFFYTSNPRTGHITGIKNFEAVQLLAITGDPNDADDRGDFAVIPSRVIVRANEMIIDPVLLGTEGIQLQAKNNSAGLPESPDQSGANIRLALALEGPLSIKQLTETVGSSLVGKNNSALRSVVRDFRSGNAQDNSSDLARGFVRDPIPPRIKGELIMFLEQVDNVGSTAQLVTLFKGGVSHEIDVGDVIRFLDPADETVFATADVILDPIADRGAPDQQHVQVLVGRIARLEDIDPSNEPGFPLGTSARESWLRLHAPRVVLIAEFTANRVDPGSGEITGDDPINFISFIPEPLPLFDGTRSPNNENVSPFAGALIRFTKPMNLATLGPLDSFFLATRNVLDQQVIQAEFVGDPKRLLDAEKFLAEYRDKFITPHLVMSRLVDEDSSQTSMRLQPTIGMYLDAEMRRIDEPNVFARKRFKYFLHVLGGSEGIRDLAGNELDFRSETSELELLVIPFSLDTRNMANDPGVPMFQDNLVVSVARRFASPDEDEQPSVYQPFEMPLASGDNRAFYPHMLARVDDVFGEATLLSSGRLQARDTSRTTRVVDNLNQDAPPLQSDPVPWCPPRVAGLFSSALSISATAAVPFVTPSGAGGIQNPFNPFGARVQSVWREVDFSLSRRDPSDFNLDVEQMYWAPFTLSPITFDEFDRISLFLGHSEMRPEPCLGGGVTYFRSSGLGRIFDNNYAFNIKAGNVNEKDDPPGPHPAYVDENLVIQASSAITEPNGINRFLPLPTFQEPYFVWRDETSNLQGGAVGSITGGARPYDTVNQPYAPYIASPFLGGSGRSVTFGRNGSVFVNTGFWGNAEGGSLRGNVANPATSVIGSSNLVERFTSGTVGAIALPLLADFQTLPDSPDLPVSGGFRASGFNGWQVSIAVGGSSTPSFRAFSGGFSGTRGVASVLVSPQSLGWRRGQGGFQLNGLSSCLGNGAAVTCGLDNSVYWVMADFLKRQSVVTAGFVDVLNPHRMPPRINGSGDPRLGPYFSARNGKFELPPGILPRFEWSAEPRLDDLPAGTSIVPEFRAASRLENDEHRFGPGRGLPEGFWRWGFHDPAHRGSQQVPNAFTTRIYTNAERPNEINFPLNPLVAGDAHIRKWDQRILPDSGLSRDYWAYYYNRQVTDYTTNIDDLTDDLFLSDFVGEHETFRTRDVRYFNWRFVMRNNIEAKPPVSPSLDSFAVTYRFEKR